MPEHTRTKSQKLSKNRKKMRKNDKKLQKSIDLDGKVRYNGTINKAADTAKKGSQP